VNDRLVLIGPCGVFPEPAQARCEACSRLIRCVYIVDDGGWVFTLGRRCFQRLQKFLAAVPA
jgi:hypothetical protein